MGIRSVAATGATVAPRGSKSIDVGGRRDVNRQSPPAVRAESNAWDARGSFLAFSIGGRVTSPQPSNSFESAAIRTHPHSSVSVSLCLCVRLCGGEGNPLRSDIFRPDYPR